ncbi:hypothetical protein DPM19_04795 [Actinomadura craniellae]|uniref:Uncharacterized protein n=1 Tax=Actinomadura craniellae TaxID=2231787 RepID=A0A365HAQ6_9ACTN|nr:hypothetical protein [Actinomadura craniellae]RAY16220.1 hypothetical protein DPM19_04795 [Actinomadura craniellae]
MNRIPALREDIARRFPLVPRPTPPCHPLEVRVRQVADLADTATHSGSDQAATSAAQALNFAALIASDCGLPDLAHQLCSRQFVLFHDARPFDAATAKLALQPLINLGRLRTRDGDGAAGHHLINTLFTAVRHQAAIRLEGISADFDGLTRTPDDHREVVRWLWTVLLTDGTRALARAGHWDQALQHLHDHKGVGHGLLDGRQIGIIAHHTLGDTRTSDDLLNATPTPTPWEAAVATTLKALTGHDVPNATLTDSYLALDDRSPRQVLFRTRLGLTMLDLADGEPDRRMDLAIEADALRTKDAYAARDILIRPSGPPRISPSVQSTLSRLLDASGLGRGTMPPKLLSQITTTTAAAETSLAEALVADGQVPENVQSRPWQ